MTIKKLAIGIAMLCTSMALVLTATQAQAKVHQWGGNRVQEFCGDRYCGHGYSTKRYKTAYKKRHKSIKTVERKEIKRKAVQVASLGNEPISERSSSSGLVAQASQYLGMTAREVGVRSTLWCSAFIRKLTNASGVDDRAISWLRKPRTNGGIGSIAVMHNHVGIVSGYDRNNNPILISGNHRHRVAKSVYPRGRILAYVSP